MLTSEAAEARENAAAVLSALARSQGGNKKAIVVAEGVPPLIDLLSDASVMTQKHAACALWGLVEGREGSYKELLVELGAVEPLIAMLLLNQLETRGFAAACLSCLCAENSSAKAAVVAAGGAEPLTALAYSPSTWLRAQAVEMLNMLGIPFKEPHSITPVITSPRRGGGSGAVGHPLIAQKALPIRTSKTVDLEIENPIVGALEKGQAAWVVEKLELGPGFFRSLIALEPGGQPKGWVTSGKEGMDFLVTEQALWESDESKPAHLKMKFHFFSFQIASTTGYMGHA